ncbi:MAG: hypothetical protein LBT16_08360 [Treponema sp.]|jgi:hypothetical protein|nr:hypothetical protein [Treponema sp.]
MKKIGPVDIILDNLGDFKMSDFEIATLDLEEKADFGRFFQCQFQN